MNHIERSKHIIKWVNEHPLINVNMLCQMAGSTDSSFFSRAMNYPGRNISRTHIDAIEKILTDYGFVPLKNQPEQK